MKNFTFSLLKFVYNTSYFQTVSYLSIYPSTYVCLSVWVCVFVYVCVNMKKVLSDRRWQGQNKRKR